MPAAPRRRLAALLLGPLMVIGLLLGLASPAGAQTDPVFPGNLGIGYAPTDGYIDLYFQVGAATEDIVFPAATGGTGALTYSLVGPHESLGFSFDPDTRIFKGTPTLAGAGPTRTDGFELTYFVDDTNGGSSRITVFVTVCEEARANPDGASFCPYPRFVNLGFSERLADQSYTVGTAVDLTLPEATGGTGTTPLYLYTLRDATRAGALPDGLRFNAASRRLSGTPTTVAESIITYGVTDAASREQLLLEFTLTVAAPLALTAPDDQNYTAGTMITELELPEATGGSGTLTYALTGPGDDGALPDGLAFDAGSRTLSGTPGTAASTELTYTVNDDNDATTSQTFTVTVNAGLALTELPRQSYTKGTAITALILPEATGGTAPLTYTLTGPMGGTLLAGLTFDAVSRTLSGTPSMVNATTLTYTVTDANDATATADFTASATTGLALNVPLDQFYIVDTAITALELPEATGGLGDLTYTLTGPVRSPLPAGLAFDAVNRTLSGTPSMVASTEVFYTVFDAGRDGLQSKRQFTVTVEAPNTAPVIGTADAAVDYAENTPVATAVATYTAPDAEGDTVTWTLGGTDAGDFSIDTNGALTFNTVRDFETPASDATSNTYFVTITATDDGGESDTLDVTVTVTNVDEDGVVAIAITRDGTTVPGAPRVGDTLTASVTDADSGSAAVTGTTWQWQSDSAGTYTDISGATAAAYSPVADDVDSTLQAVATYNDSTDSGKTATSDPTATVTAAPPGAPTNLAAEAGDTTVTLAWTAPGATGGADITGYEYRQSDATGDYDTTGSAAVVDWMAIPNSATATEYTVPGLTNDTAYFFEVRTVNSVGESEASDEVTATPTAANTAPVIGTADAAVDYAENTPVATAVATYTATDAEGDTVTWTLGGTDAGDFSIDTNGALTFNTVRDFETPASVATSNIYSVTITATDDGDPNESDTLDVTVTVTNVDDEDGVVAIAITRDGTTVPGAPRVGDTLTASVTDADSGSAAVTGTTWQWQSKSSSAGTYTDISGATAAAYSPVAGDVDRTLQAVATYNDSTGSTIATSDPTATVTAAPPGAPTGLTAMPGDATVTLAWTAPGATGGADITGYEYRQSDAMGDYDTAGSAAVVDWMAIPNSATATEYTVAGLTNDTAYFFQVRAVNSGGKGEASDEVTATPTAPELPVITGPVTLSIPENTADDVVLGTYTTTATGFSLWAIVNTAPDADLFEISGGELTFKDAPSFSPDYEAPADQGADNVYNITLRGHRTDFRPTTQDLEVTITVTNVDEPGAISAITGDAQVGATLTAGTVERDPDAVTATNTNGNVSVTPAHQWQSAPPGTASTADADDPAWTDISGATSATYEPVVGDVGRIIRVVATYTGVPGFLSQTATSAATGAVAAAPLSTDSTLSALDVSAGTLNPAFASGTDAYAVSVGTGETSVTVTPTVTDTGKATVTVNGVAVASGQPSEAIDLDVGNNTIPIVVTAEDTSTQTYTVTVARAVPQPGIALASDTARDGGTNTDRITRNRSIVVTLHADFQNDRDTWEWSSNSGNSHTTGSNTDRSFDLTASQATYNDNVVRARQTVNGVVSEFAGLARFMHDTVKPTISLNGGGASVTITKGDAYNDPVTADDVLDGPIAFSNIVITDGPVDVDTAGEYTLTYNVMDRAGNAADPLTRTVTVSEPVAATRPEPTVLSAGTITDTSIALSWDAVTNAESYTLTRVVGGADVVVFSGNALTATDTGLTPETSYKYVVTATNSAGTSADSNEVDATTLATLGPAPFLITVDENTTRFVASFTATATGTRTITGFTLGGDDAGHFMVEFIPGRRLSRGVVTFREPPNFEAPADANTDNRYEIAVTATDDSIFDDNLAREVTIRVTDAEDPGSVSITGNAQVGMTLTATVTDEDSVGAISGYQWQRLPSGGGVPINIGDDQNTYEVVAADAGDTLRVVVSYTDGFGSNTDEATSAPTATVTAALALPAQANQSYTVDTEIAELELPKATGGTGALTYALTGPMGDALPAGLSFNAASRRLTGTPTALATTILTYTVTDSAATPVVATQDFTVTVTVPAPLVLPDLDDQNYTVDTAVDVTLPAATGGIGEPTYTLTGPGDALPAGLSFNPASRTLSGTPTAAATTILTYTVTDSATTPVVATQDFTVTVNADVTLTRPRLQFYTVGTAVDVTLPVATGGTGELTYTLTGALPAGLTFTPASRTLSGTPTVRADFNRVFYTVTDANGASTTESFLIIVFDDVELPLVDNQGYTVNTAVDVILPKATGGSPPLTYALTGPGDDGALPAGLDFTARTRTLSGTPGTAAITVLTYTVTDVNGATSQTTFTVTVAVAATTPEPPQFSTGTITDTSIALSWGAVDNADSYTLTRVVDGGADVVVFSGNALTATDTGLTPETSYKYVVTATNSAGTSPDSDAVDVTTLATPPVVREFAENATGTVATFTAIATGTRTITGFTLGGTDAGHFMLEFMLDSPRGVLTFREPPNFEAPADANIDNRYEITVTATDSESETSAPTAVTIIVTNVDEPGAISAITGDAQVGEMLAAGTVTDEDSPADGTPVSSITHQWQSAVDGTDAADDAAWPDISGATSATYDPVVGDVGRIIRVVATYTDGEGGGKKVASLATGAVAAAALSTDSTLSALDVSAGTLNPTFDAATNAYAVSVGTDVASVTVTPTTTDDGAAVAVNDAIVDSGQPEEIDLDVGNNTITILVVAEDGVEEQTYTVTVARAVPRPGIALARDTARDGGTNTDRITRNRSIVVTLHADFQNDRDTWEWSSNSGNSHTTGSNTDRSFDLTASQATYNDNVVRARQTVNGVVSEFAGLARFMHDTVKPTISLNGGGASVTITKGDAYNDPVTADDVLDGPIAFSNIVITDGPVDVDTAGEYTLTYNVMDSAGNAADPLTRTVTVNDSLALTAPDDQSYTVDTAIDALILLEASGGTGTLTYTLTGLPTGLTFTAASRMLSGTPTVAAITELTYTVTDANDASTSQTFTVTVNDGLVLSAAVDNQGYTVDTAVDVTLPAATGGTAPLTYALTNLPDGLRFDAGTRTLSGTPGTAAITELTYTVTDANGASTSQTFMVTVNDSLALTAPDDQSYTVDTAITDLVLLEASGGTGTLTYTLTGLPTGLTFTAASRTLSGTPTAAASTVLTYTVTDANGASTSQTFTVTVNDGLVLTTAGDQGYTLGTTITELELPAATGGTAPLTYALTNLPDGLRFDAGTRTLSGTPGTAAITELTYTVTDANDASTSQTFTVTVNDSLALTAPDDQSYTVDTAITDLVLLEASGGTGTLTYTLTGLPTGLTFTAASRTLSGTPTAAASTVLTYTVTDTNDATASQTFTVTVNDGLALNAPGAQGYTLDTAITDLELPEATGGTAPLIYALTDPPDGLRFDAGTRTLSGTPGTAAITELTYTVTDANDASTSQTFTVTVNDSLALTAPDDQSYTVDTAITDLVLLEASGGTGTLSYTLTGLPTGLTFTAASRTLSGTPTAAASTVLTYTVTDTNDATASQTFTVTVNDGLALNAPGAQGYTLDTAIDALILPEATGGTAPLTYALTDPPAGLTFNSASRRLTGTPTAAAITELTYTVTDANDASTSQTFTVTVNDSLALTAPDDQSYTVDTAITDLVLLEASGGTGTLIYTLTGLPTGLTFTAASRTLSGTPTAAASTVLTYTVTDTNDATASQTFTVTVNDGLVLTTAGDQGYTLGTTITELELPAATGGTAPLTYALTNLPDGLRFDAGTRTLSGTPGTAAITELTYTVTDANGASTSQTFTVTVNDSLALTAPDDQSYTVDTAITDLALLEASGGTGTLTYTLTGLPTGLTFTAASRTLSGTPTAAASTVLTYTVTDTNDATASQTFTVTVNDGLALNAPGAQGYTLDTAITDLELPEATGGTAPLIYALTDPPDGLRFDAGTRTLSGTPGTAAITELTYTVTDANDASTSQTVTVTVNDSLALTAPDDQSYTVDTAITDLVLLEASGGTGTLSYTLTGLPTGLTFTAASRTLSGTPTAAASTVLTYTVTDANGASTSQTFDVTVNDGVTLPAPGDQGYTLDTAIDALILPEATGGTAPLTYALTDPPAGLTFNSASRRLTGTPTAAAITELTYTVTDANDASTSQTFTVTVNDGLVLTTAGDQGYTLDTTITDLELPEATGGTAPLIYALTDPPAGLAFNPTNRTLSGTPGMADVTVLTYTVTDANDATTSQTFMVTVSDGLALSAPPAQSYTAGTLITPLALSAATGGTGTLTYTLTGPGAAATLPDGLTFTAGTRMLSGTPTVAAITELTYTVTDANGASTSQTFTVTVNDGLALNAPGAQGYTLDTTITDLELPEATGGTAPLIYALTDPPAGLAFNPTNRTLSGTPGMADVTVLTYTVTDANDATTSQTFMVTVSDGLALSAPPAQSYTAGTLITPLALSAATGGTGTPSYTLTGPAGADLPDGLDFNAGTRTLSGTPTAAASTVLTYTVTDTNDATASQTFTVTVNDGLVLTAPDDQSYTLDTAIDALILPEATGGTAPLTYALTDPPDGLRFDAGTRTLSGTPGTAASTELTYTVTDANDASTSQTFMVTVNDSLALTAPDDQSYTVDTAITNLVLLEASGGTGTLTYTLTGALPTGLTFTAASRTLSGTPTAAASTVLTYTVTDTNDATASQTFTVTVNDGLVLTTAGDQGYTLGTTITELELPAATGGTAPLTYALTDPPAGLAFNPTNRTLSGTPGTAAITELTYTVTDANGASTSQTFTVTVNDSLALTAPDDQSYTVDTAITDLVLLEASGGTGTLTYTLTGLPTGLTFTAASRTLSGTPTAAASTVLTYTVTDTNDATASQTFTVTVNDGLVLTTAGDQGYTLGTTITELELPAATGGTAPLTYALTNLPDGLRFDAGTRTLSGTPGTAAITELTYTVTDANDASTSQTFTVTVNDSLALTAPDDQSYTVDTAITDLVLLEASGGTGTLIYTLTGLPTGLTFTAASRTLSGTPTAAASTVLTYTVTDTNDATASQTFTVTVNDGLVLTTAGDQGYTLGTTITELELPAATGGTAPLTYALTNLPDGLRFDAGTRTLSGTPGTAAITELTYTVTDANGASTSQTFTVTVNDSLALTAPDDQSYTVDTAITDLALLEASGGTGTLTYTLTGLPTGLTFTAASRTLSGTPTAAASTVLTYTVTDTNDATASQTFTVTVNDGLALNAPGAQGYTLDTAITDLELPEATGGTAPLIYALTDPPDGLRFDAGTRTLSGTPGTAAITELTYTVTDANGASTSQTFTVTVNDSLALTAPDDQSYTVDTAITDLVLLEASGGTGTLSYTLTGLPTGLTFTAASRTLSGTPTAAASTVLTYTVTDANGASTSQTFDVTVNDGVTLPAPGDQGYTLDTAIDALILPEATGGTAPLTYALTDPPDGLRFDAGTRTLSGTPGTAAITELTYTVTDANDASTSQTFTVTVNDSLALTAPDDQSYTVDTAITDLVLLEASGGTGTLTYTLTGLPTGLTFTAASRTLSGTPTAAASTVLTYTVTDTNDATASQTFTVTVNDGLVLTTAGDQGYTLGTTITELELPAATGGTAPLTYALTNLPDGLRFDAGTRTLSGTPGTAAITELTYTVTDANDASTSQTVTVTVNDSLALTAPDDQSYTVDTAITDLVLLEASGGTGTLSYTLTGLPTGLTFTAASRTLSGTPTAAASTVLTYTVTDTNDATASQTFTVTVNDGLALNAPGAQGYTLDTAITDLELPEATGGTAPLIYALTDPPDGLRFDAGTRTLSGTPGTAAITELTYTVTDANDASTSQTVTVTVNDSLALTAPDDQSYTVDTAITDLVLLEASGGTGTLTYTLTGLPTGLTFTAASRTLSGTPTAAASTVLTYTVTDTNDATASQTFTVTVNDGLVLTTAGDQGYTLDTAIDALILPEATGGTAPLTYALTDPPAGLTFNSASRRLTGTPTAAAITELTYTVTDANDASTSQTFTVTVNDGLVLTTAGDQGYTLDTTITDLELPEATGGTAPLIYALTDPPAGLAFNPTNRTLSGTPGMADVTVLTYTVTDANDATTSQTFMVTVSDGLALSAPPAQSYTAGTLITPLALSAATGGTGTLTYTLTGLPTGLTFTAASRTLSGTPTAAASTVLTYTVTDTNDATASQTFTVTVNDGLALNAPGAQGYTLDTAIDALILPEATGGTAPLTYALTDPPAGLTFNSASRRLTGTPTAAAITELTYTVTDTNDATASQTFTVTVNDGLALNAPGAQGYTLDTAITDLELPEATGGTAPLIYALTDPPDGLRFDAGTRTLSGTPGTAAITELTYTVTDANDASTSQTFTVTVNGRLVLSAAVDNQGYTVDTAVDVTLPEATGGTAPLTYALTDPPDGLRFDAGTRTLSGTPGTAAITELTYTVTDANGATTSQTFTVTVNDSLALTAPDDQSYTVDTAITNLVLLEASGGTGTLTYTLTGLPTGLTFTAASRTLSGTPTAAASTVLTYTVTDTNDATASQTFTVTVNDGLALNAPGAQGYTLDTAIDALILPEATGGTAPLTYALTDPPAGLTFNSASRRLTGTPTAAAITELTYTVTDTNDATASQTFTVTVNDGLALNAPGAQGYTLDTAITDLELPEATGGTAPLTYALTDPPAGLTFNSASRRLTGTPTAAAITELTYTVTDANGATTSQTFMVTVSDGLALSAPPAQSYTAGTLITPLALSAATGGTGTLSYTLTGPAGADLPDGLDFNAGTRTLSGTPTAAASTVLTYTVTDANGASTSQTFTVTVNDGLVLTTAGDQGYTLDTTITDLELPEATGGTAPLIYALTDPPAGLTFNSASRRLTGTPTAAAITELTYTVTDANGATTSQTFMVTVSDGLALSAPPAQSYTAGTLITPLALSAATGGTGTLSYTLTGPAGADLPDGLDFNAGTRTLSGTPTAAASTVLTYTVTDTNDATASQTFTVTVNDDVALPDKPDDQFYTVGTAVDVTLPEGIGGTGTLRYTLTGPGGAALPAGLRFDEDTRKLTGTPTEAASATTLTYTVTDNNGSNTLGESDSQTFTVTVAATPPEPTVLSEGTITDTSIALSWGAVDNAESYTLTRVVDGGADVVVFSGNALTATDENLDADTEYKYTITAINSAGMITSTEFSARTLMDTTPPTVTLGTIAEDVIGTIAEGVIGTAQDYDITFSEAVTGLAVDDFSVSKDIVASGDVVVNSVTPASAPSTTISITPRATRRASASDKASNGTTYTISITPRATAFTLTLAAGSVTDLAGNPVAETRITGTAAGSAPEPADLNRTILPEVARAIAGHTVGAIARRVTQARADGVTDSAGSFNLGGQTTVAGVAGALASHGQAMADGTLSLKDLLGGGDFVLPLNARAAAGAPGLSSLAFWGAGDYSNLDGSGGAVDWDGDLFSAHLGADARLRDDLLVGLAVSWSRVDLDYSVPGRSGDYELDLTSFHPYVGWSALSGKLDLWATVGYGWGDLEIADETQQASSDVEMRTVAVGGLGRLLKVGATTLRLKGDALLTEMEVEGSDEMAALTVDARRVRMILEGSRTHTLADGAQLEPSLEVGVRHDGGDGETGFGAELGGGVRYSNPVMGLTLEGRARTLVGRDSYGEWGVNGLIRLERGNGRGLSFNLSPGYGKTGSGTQRLWQQGLHDKIDGERDYGARMDLRLGYGLPAFGGRGLLTPYSELTFGDSARNYRLGMEWELGALFELNLTGERHESSDGAADHAIMLKGEVRF